MNKVYETGPPVYRPYPRRLESLIICRRQCKDSTFSSVIIRPWVLVRPEIELTTSRPADRRSPNWANRAAVACLKPNQLGIMIDWWWTIFFREPLDRHINVFLVKRGFSCFKIVFYNKMPISYTLFFSSAPQRSGILNILIWLANGARSSGQEISIENIRAPSSLRAISIILAPDLALADRAHVLKH